MFINASVYIIGMEKIFVAGPPVSGELFYGRKEVLESIKFGNNYALLGIRRVGKTSIILELTKKLKKQGITPVVVSLFEVSPLNIENFLKRYTLAVTRAYLQDASLVKKIEGFFSGQKEGLISFLKNVKVSVSLQENVELWFEYGENKPKDYTQAIEKTILYPEKLAKESNKKIVVFLDEFQEIKNLGILNALRENMQKTTRVNYVISGSAVGLLAQIVGSRKSPFYGFFLQKQIRGLSEESAEKLLSRTKKKRITIEPSVVQKVVQKTRGYPLYLQAFGNAALDLAFLKKTRKIGDELFDECWQRMFEDIYFHFQYLEGELKGKKRAIAEAIALDAPLSVSAISRSTGIPINELGTYTNRLVREGILEKNNSAYSFTDPVFEEWLKKSKQERA